MKTPRWKTMDAVRAGFSRLDAAVLLDTKEAAAVLGISHFTLKGWRFADPPKGPAFVKLGSATRYSVGALRAYLEAVGGAGGSGGGPEGNRAPMPAPKAPVPVARLRGIPVGKPAKFPAPRADDLI